MDGSLVKRWVVWFCFKQLIEHFEHDNAKNLAELKHKQNNVSRKTLKLDVPQLR